MLVPVDADPVVLRGLRDLGADVVTVPRTPGVPGDPTYARMRAEVAAGALPFTCQGNENGLVVEGGETLAWEMASALAAAGTDLDHLVVQVGGGALASACLQGLRRGGRARRPRPRATGAHRADDRRPPARAGVRPGPRGPARRRRAPAEIAVAMRGAARHRSAYMWPWEEEPRSIATGILDDETYDWRAVVDGMLTTGGRPLVVAEESPGRVPTTSGTRRASASTPPGRPGSAGLLDLVDAGDVGPDDRVGVLFTGVDRQQPEGLIDPTDPASPRDTLRSERDERSAGPGGPPRDVAPTSALCGATVVVALDPPEVVAADVVLAGDRVAWVGEAPPGVPRRDCSGTLVLPGNVCAHHHLYSALSRGMPYRLAPPVTFTEILQRVWWRLDRALDEPAIRASALRGGLDALRAGTTTIVDHHASPHAVDGSLDIIADTLAGLGRAQRALLRGQRPRRSRAGRRRRRREPPLHRPAPTA